MNAFATGSLLSAFDAFSFASASCMLKIDDPFAPTDGDSIVADTMLAHSVYFTLHDASDAAKTKLVDACKKYLIDHIGAVFFACGVRSPEYQRPVNDVDFDVALHIIFRSKADHDAYQKEPRHDQFIVECKDNWKKVRVFDSVV